MTRVYAIKPILPLNCPLELVCSCASS